MIGESTAKKARISWHYLRASAIETDVTVTVSHPPNRIGKFYVALMKTAARSAAKKIYVALMKIAARSLAKNLRTTNENSRAQRGEKITYH